MISAVCLTEGEPPISIAAATAIRHVLIEQVRLGIDDAVWNPEERVYDLSGKTAQDIYTLHEAGLLIHANMSWCAPWKAGGSIWMRPYTSGCARYVDTHDPVDPAKYGGGWEFADDRDYCVNPTHISAKWQRRSGEMFGQWFSRGPRALLHAVSCGNEPDGEIYNAVLHAHTQDEAMERYAREYSYPFLEGVRSKTTSLIVGPEAAGGDGLRRMLEWAEMTSEMFMQFELGIVSAHGYASDEYPGFPDGALLRWEKEFMPEIAKYRPESKPVPAWNTEGGANNAEEQAALTPKGVETYLSGMEQMGVEVVTWNNVKQLFVDYGKGNYTPTEIGYVFRDFNLKQQVRRRPVAKDIV